MADESMTLREAATRLGVTATMLRQAANRGTLLASRVVEARGMVWMVTPEEVERYRKERLGKPGRKRKGGRHEHGPA